MRTAVQLGTPLTLGNLSQSQAMASVPLPLQFQSQRSALQEERLKSASSLAESVKAATSITQSAPLPQQSLAAGSQTFDLGSAQKVGLDHQENVVSHLLAVSICGPLCWIELADLCRFECLHASLEVFGLGEGMVSFFKILECYTHQMRLWSMWAGFTVGSRDSLFIISKWPVCHSKSRVPSLSSGRNCRYY